MKEIDDTTTPIINSDESIDSTLAYVTPRLFYSKDNLSNNISDLLQGLDDFCAKCTPGNDSVKGDSDRIYIVKTINNKDPHECYSRMAIFLEYYLKSQKYYINFQVSPSESAFINMGYNSDVYKRNPCALSVLICSKHSLEELEEWVRTTSDLDCECTDHAVRLIGNFPRLIDECDERY